jgi:hypothetical protein
MKCTIRSCTSSAVLQTQSKNISRLNEVSTRAAKTRDVAREAASLLVKRRDVLSVARDFATDFATMQKTLVKCGFLACAAHASDAVSIVADRVRARTKSRESMRAATKNRCAKFFSTASLNRPLQQLIAIGIERITHRAIRSSAIKHRRDDACGETKTRREGQFDESKAPIRVVHATFAARGTHARERRAAGTMMDVWS